MFRIVLAAAVVAAALVPKVRATDDDDRARRARVALAGNAALNRVKAAAALTAPDCGGQCRTDLDTCREEAKKDGKVIVLWVGGCKGNAAAVGGPGVLNVRVSKYDADRPDDATAAAKFDPVACRVVILSRDTTKPGDSLYLWGTYPIDTAPALLNKAVADAKAKAANR